MTLYERVLLWAYHRGAESFTWNELGDALKLSPGERKWVEQALYLNMYSEQSLFGRVESGSDKFTLTPRGFSLADQYLQSKRVETRAAWAQWTAIGSLIIGALVGLAQVLS